VKTKSRRTAGKRAAARLRERLDRDLMALQSAGLIRQLIEQERAYLFKHVLIQDTAYESLLKQDRRQLHRRVAETLESQNLPAADEVAARLAHHYAEAEDDAKTLEYASRAGDVAARVYANREAVENYSLAIKAAARSGASHEQWLHLFIKRGRALELRAEFAGALDNYLEMERLARAQADGSLELAALVSQGTLHSTTTPLFDAAQARALADRALSLARELGERAAEPKILWNLLVLNRFMGQGAHAVEYGERALALARELGLNEQIAFVANDLAGVYLSLGQMDRMRVLLDQSRTLWQNLDNLPMLADNLSLSATVAMVTGNYDRALAFTEQGIQISTKIGSVHNQSAGQGTQIDIFADWGEMERALALCESNVRLAQDAHLSFFLALQQSEFAWLLATLGGFEQSLELAQLACKNLDATTPPFFRSWVYAYNSMVYVANNDLTAAADAVQQIDFGPNANPIEPAILFGSLGRAEYALARQAYVEAIEGLDPVIASFSRHGINMPLAEMYLLQARGFRGLGEVESAVQALHHARIHADALKSRRILWQVHALLGEIESARGNLAEAQSHRAEARTYVEYIASHTPAELRDSFLSLPGVRAVRVEE
jgi:MalT-like TPR region